MVRHCDVHELASGSAAAALGLMLARDFEMTYAFELGTYHLKTQDQSIPLPAETADQMLSDGLVSLSYDDGAELFFLLTAEGRRRAR